MQTPEAVLFPRPRESQVVEEQKAAREARQVTIIKVNQTIGTVQGGHVTGTSFEGHSPPWTEGFISFSVPAGMAFGVAAELLGQHAHKNVKTRGFRDDELQAPLKAQALECESIHEALRELGPLAASVAIRRYEIVAEGQQLILQPVTP